ncbi:hypothetical protein DAEQUDRAFT_734237 [Daedalea quercina L-15889]|uniref:Uncharacterized protein n=1 Tax=Daedalea quercina L-15889 TaxID=1314783 RepID=A0A165KFC7_9APHY|nr:hypothetical protein DAEQUDRAFT_734242 [Daedalea quercina L-15889]KZT63065.1 hypothetical protein DAEQUDRAFT_734237 [Daedalea quercina L-15889]
MTWDWVSSGPLDLYEVKPIEDDFTHEIAHARSWKFESNGKHDACAISSALHSPLILNGS